MLYLCLWLALVVSMLPSNVEDAQYVWALLIIMATRRAYVLRLPRRTSGHRKDSRRDRASERADSLCDDFT